jgi:hypothetical protein
MLIRRGCENIPAKATVGLRLSGHFLLHLLGPLAWLDDDTA